MSTREGLRAAAREELITGFDARMKATGPASSRGYTEGQRLQALGETVIDMIAKRDAQIEAILGRLES